MDSHRLLNQNINSNQKSLYTSTPNDHMEKIGLNEEGLRSFKKSMNATNNIGKLNAHKSDNTDKSELIRLRPRGATANIQSYTTESLVGLPANVVYLERDIVPSDTLQSFALLYGCTINDLKRVNNLINEQDFFALRRIKIPVKKYGLLSEPEEELKRRAVVTTSLISSDDSVSSDITFSKPHLSNQHMLNDVYHILSDDLSDEAEHSFLLNAKSPSASKEATVDQNDTGKYLKSVDKEIRKTIKKNAQINHEKNEVLNEVVSSLGSVGYRPLPLPSSSVNNFDGSTWGIKWLSLVICFTICLVLILILVGVKYFLFNTGQTSTYHAFTKPNRDAS